VIPAFTLAVKSRRDRERQNGARRRDGDRSPAAHYVLPRDFLVLGFSVVVVVGPAFRSLSASCSALVACVVAVRALVSPAHRSWIAGENLLATTKEVILASSNGRWPSHPPADRCSV
jgi:hypothetical protein